jgi:hypothetical protein
MSKKVKKDKKEKREKKDKKSKEIKKEDVIKDEKVVISFKSIRRQKVITQGKQRIYPLTECYDSDDKVELDASLVTNDPSTIFAAASQVFAKLTYT